MSQVLFEQYKDALRRGHVAALHGKLEAAVSAFEAAAAIAPDRALPQVSLAQVLERLGRDRDADAAYTAALQRSPTDEGALRGRASLRMAMGRSLDAARDLEVLAVSLERDGRLAEACDAARAALEIAESRTRRRMLERLAGLLRDLDADPLAAEARRQAVQLLEQAAGAADDTEGSANPQDAQPGPSTGVDISDPARALRKADALLDSGDASSARTLLLALARSQRASGHLDAALDACLTLMAIDPADAAVQLELAANQALRGWSALATDKARLLARLAELDADTAATSTIRAFAVEHGLSLDDSAAQALAGPSD